MLSGFDIIILSGVFYDDMWTSKQQIARRLALQNRVLFVEPYLTLITPVSVPGETSHWKKSLGNQSLRFFDGLYVYSPHPLLPFRHYADGIQYLNAKLYLASIRKTLKKLNFHQPILWSFIHDAGDVIGNLKERLSIYQCADDWAEMPLPHKVKHRIRKLEAQTAAKANIIFSAAKKNAERLSQFNPMSYYTPNGVDFDLFNQAAEMDFPIPDDLKNIPAPRLCFIGTLHEWVDYDLLAYVADQKPEWSILLIGPRMVDTPQLLNKNNVHFLGKKKREQLPAYLRHVDACLIPFKVNKLTNVVNPLKLYEYLATGKPVISSDLSEVKTALPFVNIAENYERYVQSASKAIEEGDRGAQERINFAKANSWEARIQLLSGHIENWLKIHKPENLLPR